MLTSSFAKPVGVSALEGYPIELVAPVMVADKDCIRDGSACRVWGEMLWQPGANRLSDS
jgi:hypothetical protein